MFVLSCSLMAVAIIPVMVARWRNKVYSSSTTVVLCRPLSLSLEPCGFVPDGKRSRQRRGIGALAVRCLDFFVLLRVVSIRIHHLVPASEIMHLWTDQDTVLTY